MGDELLLLAIVPRRRRTRIRNKDQLRFALRTAELADLGLSGRISVGHRRIRVLDTRDVEDRRLNAVLRALGSDTPPPGVTSWLRRTPLSLTSEYLSRLEEQGTIRFRRRRDPGGPTGYDILHVDLARREELLARVDAVVRSGSAPSGAERDLTLAVLVHAAGLAGTVYPGLRGIVGRRRMAALAASAPLATTGEAPIGDEGLATALTAGVSTLTNRLRDELSSIYSDVTTGGHGIVHDLNAHGWSGGGHHHGGGHHGGGHHSGGHHGGGHHGGGHHSCGGGGGW